MPEVLCRHFSGYKPCGLSSSCDSFCPSKSIPSSRVLLIHLGAMGAVLRSTSLLAPVHKKFPQCHLTWVTDSPAQKLLENNPKIDRVLTTSESDLLALSVLEFDAVLVVDKSLKAAGVLKKTKAKKIYGFRVESVTGAILPATEAASELWEIGLSDHKKFFLNQKPETLLVTEALELVYRRSEYEVVLSAQEIEVAKARKKKWQQSSRQLIGINTGCSPIIPYKKMSITSHRQLIKILLNQGYDIVLLGGSEDTERNIEIAEDLRVSLSPTVHGLRDGLVSMQACDIVISGDSLGMHMAIGLKKWVVAWFGPTCANEIDLYDRGVKILAEVSCGPCWKRTCHKEQMCYDKVDLQKVLQAIREGEKWLMSYSTPHLSETSSSAYPSSEPLKKFNPIEI